MNYGTAKRDYLASLSPEYREPNSQQELEDSINGAAESVAGYNVAGAGLGQIAPAPSAQKVGSSEGWLSKLLASANTDETPEEKAAREKSAAAGNIPTNPSGERALKMKQMSENFTNYAREMKNQAIARESVDKGRQFDAAASGPAMLAMIQSMGKRDQENRFRTNGLSAMAGI